MRASAYGIVRALALIGGFISFSTAVFSAEDRIQGPVDRHRTIMLKGNIHRGLRTARDHGAVDPGTPIRYARLVLAPSAAQSEDLENFLEAQRDPASASYQNWLTPEEFGERFGASISDLGRLTVWVQSQGLTVDIVARARNWISISGPAEQFTAAFHTEIHRYEVDGEMHFANSTEPSVPAAFAGVVAEIRGLDDFRPKPQSTPRLRPVYTTSSGAHYLAPDDLAAIYNISSLYQGGFDGTGQKLVIAGQTEINISDIRNFRSTFNLPAKDPQLVLVGPSPGFSQGDAVEADLDLEWSGAVARNATIIYVYSANVFESVQYAIDQNLAPVLSLSYGGCEFGFQASYRSVAQQAAAQGITWMNSSGDSGAAGCDPQGASSASQGPAVSFPANIPEVTAVGGTEFNETGSAGWNVQNGAAWGSAISYIPERAWNDTPLGHGIEGTGGGASTVYPKPWWQSGAGVPNDGARDVPDISLSASGAHDGYIMYAGGGLMSVGGTSASSPAFAGIISLLNQYLVAKGVQSKPGVGNINPMLYRLAQNSTGVFHDITVGDNMVPCATGSRGCTNGSLGYATGPGYDLVTGLGSVDAYNLVTKWATLPASIGTTLTMSASPASIAPSGTTQLTARLSAVTGSNPPSGNVTFTSGSTLLGSAAAIVSGAGAGATLTVDGSALAVGNNTIVAAFSATGNFANSTASAIVTVTSSPVPTSTAVTASPASFDTGASTQLTVRVTPATGTAAPAGSVAFTIGKTALGSVALTAAGTGSGAVLQVKGSSLALGANSIVATYTPSGNFAISTTSISVTVTVPPVATATTMSATPTTLAITGTVQLTATVRPASGSAAPSGTVAFSAGTASLGSVALVSAGPAATASLYIKGSGLTVGVNTITATYTPVGAFARSTATVSVTVTPPVATSATLAASPASLAATGTTQLTAIVKPASGSVPPAGTITFSAGNIALGYASVSPSGSNATAGLSIKASSLAIGNNTITASYAATGNFSNSTATTTVVVTAPPITTSITFSASPATLATGGATLLTASIKPASGTALPAGTVTFSAGSAALGSASVLSGVATLVVKASSLAIGANSIIASYSAPAQFANSIANVTVTVTPPPIATVNTVTASPSSIASSASTQLTAVVRAASGTTAPTGSVTFSIGGAALGTASLAASGSMAIATLTVKGSSLAAGGNVITATYSAAANFSASAGTVTVTVTASPASNVVPGVTAKSAAPQTGFGVAIQLQELAGVSTTLTGFTINGTDYSSVIAATFGSTQVAARGTLYAYPIIQWKPLPATLVFGFSGVDANGRRWTQTVSLNTASPNTAGK